MALHALRSVTEARAKEEENKNKRKAERLTRAGVQKAILQWERRRKVREEKIEVTVAADVTTVPYLRSHTVNQSSIILKTQRPFRCLLEL